VDTPGIHKPLHKLGDRMVESATQARANADVIVFLADVSELPSKRGPPDRGTDSPASRRATVILALNKMDRLPRKSEGTHRGTYWSLGGRADRAVGLDDAFGHDRRQPRQAILEMIVARLPEGPQYYPRRSSHRPTDAQGCRRPYPRAGAALYSPRSATRRRRRCESWDRNDAAVRFTSARRLRGTGKPKSHHPLAKAAQCLKKIRRGGPVTRSSDMSIGQKCSWSCGLRCARTGARRTMTCARWVCRNGVDLTGLRDLSDLSDYHLATTRSSSSRTCDSARAPRAAVALALHGLKPSKS